ncbi:MAG: FixH family protein [Bacteroidetes bacterium]|nr:FixH family protein [Bacteroidota bacterium]
MIKFNWGTGIFLFILVFIIACIWFFIYAIHQHISFVEDNYYPKGLKYEEKLKKMRNMANLHEPLLVAVNKTDLSVTFPADFIGQKLNGQILIYRPSDEKLDITVPIRTDTAMTQHVLLTKLVRGKYVVKLEWSSEGKDFYKEQEIYIP